jgi:hypothetical protein
MNHRTVATLSQSCEQASHLPFADSDFLRRFPLCD